MPIRRCMCSRADLISLSAQCQDGATDVCGNTSTTCPATLTLQYIEQSLTGYNASRGKTGFADVRIRLDAARDRIGRRRDLCCGQRRQRRPATDRRPHLHRHLHAFAGRRGDAPDDLANGVVNGASFAAGIVPGSWLTIYGNESGAADATPGISSIVNGKLPTTRLDGVSVTVGSQQAFVVLHQPRRKSTCRRRMSAPARCR